MNDDNISSSFDDNYDDDDTDYFLNVKFINSLYVEESILEWFENEMLTRFPVNNIIVEEIYHNKFDENINHVISDRSSGKTVFNRILMSSKYKMCWLSDRTYFINIDSEYETVLNYLMDKLKQSNLMDFIVDSYQKKVAWITMEEIHIFVFSNELDENQLYQIDHIFIKSIRLVNQIDKIIPLYLTVPLPWHYAEFDFIEIDTLAMDICAEEWKQYDLLSDFSIEELLSLELANKDFRVPYYNDYLDRNIQKELTKKLTFSMEDEELIEYSLPTTFDNENLIGYLIYKYYKKFSKLYTAQSECKTKFDYITKLLKIPSYEFVYDKMIFLEDNEPDINNLVNRYKGIETIIYYIRNYNHFTCELFCELMQNPNLNQIYEFNFSDGINFTVPVCYKALPVLNTNITVTVSMSSVENEDKLCRFIKYLIQVLKGNNSKAEFYISDCYLFDYVVFKNINEAFLKIEFTGMDISHANLVLLASYMSKKTELNIIACSNIADISILAMFENSAIDPKNISFDNFNGFTPLVYYMLAELLIKRDKVKSIHLNEMMHIKEAYQFKNNHLEFYEEDDIICLRNFKTGEQIDLFYFMNNISMDKEEPPFDYT